MGNTQKTTQAVVCTLGGALLLAVLAACSGGAPGAAESPAPTPSASATPTASPAPATAHPADPARSAEWAAEAFPVTGTDQYVVYTNGQDLVDGEGKSSVATEAAPGDYELRIACQGDAESTVTVTAESPGVAPAVVSAPCDSSTQAAPFSMVNTSVTVTIATAVDGGQPVDWASVIATLPAT